MLTEIESDLTERKESFQGDAPSKIRQAVCAFANDLPNHRKAGVIFVGARDDGTPSGLPITDALLLSLTDIKTDGNIVPPPSMTVQKRLVSGVELAVLTVEPADAPPARFKGQIWIRTGPRRDIATQQDERILNEKRRHRDRPFDVRPVPSATIADLDRRLFEGVYLPSSIPIALLDANNRSYEERLASLKMIASTDDTTPTVLGTLVLGTRTRDFLPGAYIQFLRIRGTTIPDPVVDDRVIDGPIGEVLKKTDDKFAAHIRTAVEITSGPVEIRRHDYPLEGLQQFVRNAVLHRNYEGTNAPVRVYWFDDRVEIISPGGPYGSVTRQNFGQPGIADYRNPNLAEALHGLGFIQRFGYGIGIARQALQKNGNPPPEFDVQQSHVIVTVRRSP